MLCLYQELEIEDSSATVAAGSMRVDIASSAVSQLHDTTLYPQAGIARETGGEDADLVSTQQQGERGYVGVYNCTCTCTFM